MIGETGIYERYSECSDGGIFRNYVCEIQMVNEPHATVTFIYRSCQIRSHGCHKTVTRHASRLMT